MSPHRAAAGPLIALALALGGLLAGLASAPAAAQPVTREDLPPVPRPLPQGDLASRGLSPLARAVLEEINLARTEPAAYARIVAHTPLAYRPEDVREAVAFLERQPPLPPLAPDLRLTAVARDLAFYQAVTGGVGHGAEGQTFPARLREEQVFGGITGEVVSYGETTARGVVVQFIIDPDTPGRGHRMNLFDRLYDHAGAACTARRSMGGMCVVDLAGMMMHPGAEETQAPAPLR
ncbi:MAG: hypothetical protein KGL69_01630 [Alphaproteobacteria bacterium]|nr:hypothetical protein [Alphaproteobacteria bacterium]